MKKIWYTIVLAAPLCGLTGCFEEEMSPAETAPVSETVVVGETELVSETANPASYQQISQEEAKRLMESETNYIILDVRRQDEFDAGHIPGAILIPNETITDTPPAELPDLHQMILIYCRSGNRSKQAAEKLANMGYTNLYEFGGINTWDGTIVTSGEVDQIPSEELERSASADGWKSAYREILIEYQASCEDTDDETNSIGWDLQDLDQDGTPELLISEGMFHVAGVLFYDYANGNAQPIPDDRGEPLRYGVYGEALVCPEEHLLGVGNMHMGYQYTVMHRYENRKLTQLLSFMEDSGAVGEENVTYTVNDETTDKAAYDAALEEFLSKKWIAAGRAYRFDDFSALS